MRRTASTLIPALLATLLAAPAMAADSPATPGPRNVILIIGDGMDDHQVTIARNYLKGARGRLLLDEMPVRGSVQVLTRTDEVNGAPVYVADSANTATSIATGVVTSRGRIATSAGDDRDLPTIVEQAAAAGLRTGLVTTASVTSATPAAFAAHVSFRMCENPEKIERIVIRDIELPSCPQDMVANGGPGAISEQLALSPVDVLLGGGQQHFAPQAKSAEMSVAALAQREGFQVIDSAAALDRVQPGQRVLGLFAPDKLPVRLHAEGDRAAEQPEPSLLNRLHPYLGEVTQPAIMRCEPNPAFGDTPTLKAMTDTALRLLSSDNPRGFFLMVESESIDKEAHERRPCGSIGEVEQLQEALASALAFADTHPDTLVLVTADHSQAAQLVPYESLYAGFPIPIYSPGHIARIETPEGSYMAVNYATNNFSYEEHTGAAVPLYGNETARELLPTFIQQPELYRVMAEYLKLEIDP